MDFKSTNLLIEKELPKLVRDRIPEIIEANSGKAPEVRTLSDDAEYRQYLFKKVVEESVELQNSDKHQNVQEEIADVLELVDTILEVENITMEDIRKIQQEKREKNGGFKKRILLLSK